MAWPVLSTTSRKPCQLEGNGMKCIFVSLYHMYMYCDVLHCHVHIQEPCSKSFFLYYALVGLLSCTCTHTKLCRRKMSMCDNDHFLQEGCHRNRQMTILVSVLMCQSWSPLRGLNATNSLLYSLVKHRITFNKR